ncbi:hypothetical protein B0H19DRAFT_1073183 [Mycena capillaripes]|nr:hypothetical protein B0H19DRAFT_1073183 [Mycena capillaripes]
MVSKALSRDQIRPCKIFAQGKQGLDVNAPSSCSKVGRDHQCVGCDNGFFDIRVHFESADCKCNKTKFRIRDPSKPPGTFGPTFLYNDWVKTAPPLDPAGFKDKSDSKRKGRANAAKDQRCHGCKAEFADVLVHFCSLKKTSKPECLRRKFSDRTSTGWGPVIDYATWEGNPIVVERARMSPSFTPGINEFQCS